MYFPKKLSLFFAFTLTTACTASVIKHQPTQAASSAEAFGTSAFVVRNYRDALPFVKDGESVDDVSAMVERLHPSGRYPVSIVAASYEPMPGKESIKIYLEGSGADSTYHYLAIMEGTESKGYKVSAMARSEDPFPGSNDVKPLR